jgi:hypothetical protein
MVVSLYHRIRHLTLITPTKHGGCKQFTTSGGIQSDLWLPPFWAKQPAVWFTQAKALFLGRHQQQEDQVLPRYPAAGPLVGHRSRGHYHLSTASIPLHHAEDRAPEAAAPRREKNASASYLRSIWTTIRHPGFLGTSEALPQTCWTTSSTPSGPTAYPPTFKPFSSASSSLGSRSLPSGPHLRGRTPAGASKRCWSTHNSTALLQGIEDISRQVAVLNAEQTPSSHQLQEPAPQLQ